MASSANGHIDGASLKMGNGVKLSNDNCDTHVTTARQQRGKYSGPLAGGMGHSPQG